MNKIKLLLTVSKTQWRYLSVGLLLSIITMVASIGLLSVAGFLICGAAIAGLTTTAGAFNYFLPAAIVRFFALTRILSRYGDRVLTHDATFRILKNLRTYFYKILEPRAFEHLVMYRSSDILNRMISDINALDKVYIRLFIPFCSSLILVILTTGLLYLFNPVLGICLLCILLIGIVITPITLFLLGKKTSATLLIKFAELRIDFIEIKNYLMDLILYGKIQERITSLNTKSDNLMQLQQKQAILRGFVNAWLMMLNSISLFVVLLMGITLIHQGQLSAANLGLLVLLTFALFEAINALPQASQYLGETNLAAQRILELAAQKPELTYGNNVFNNINYDLKFDQISFQYTLNSRKIFDNFSLTIPLGTHLVIVGASGIGKSTLGYLATRCFDPNSGEIMLDSHSIKLFTETQLRDCICYITQNSYLFHSSIKENLLIAKPNATDQELLAALNQVNLQQEVLLLPKQLDTLMGEFGTQFSGGQMRRFALARAFLKVTPITILDEPFEGVDAKTTEFIWANLTNYFEGKTVIVITHQIKQVPKNFHILEL